MKNKIYTTLFRYSMLHKWHISFRKIVGIAVTFFRFLLVSFFASNFVSVFVCALLLLVPSFRLFLRNTNSRILRFHFYQHFSSWHLFRSCNCFLLVLFLCIILTKGNFFSSQNYFLYSESSR